MSKPRQPFQEYERGTWIEDESWAERSLDGFGRRARVLTMDGRYVTVRCSEGDPKELGGITAFFAGAEMTLVTEPTSWGIRAPLLRIYPA